MATRQAAISEKLQIKLDGVYHKLSVTVRHNHDVSIEQLIKLTTKTVSNWCTAWQATQTDNRDYKMNSACFICEVEPSKDDPYVTVWNVSSAISLTVHSHSDGETAVLPFFAYQDALKIMQDAKPDMFSQPAPQASTPSNITSLPQQPVAPSNSLNPFVRATKVFGDDVMIETGKTDNPSWGEATKAKGAYDSTAPQYDPNTIALYRLLPCDNHTNVRVREHDGTKILSFQLQDGNDIAVWEREDTIWDGKTIKSDWNQALSKLGVEAVVVGQGFSLQADFIAMKAGKVKDGKQYKNFYGFFNAPESVQLAATGTDGLSQAMDKTVKPLEDDRDYSQIPF